MHTYDFEGRVWPLARQKGLGLVAIKVFGGVRRGAALMSRDLHDAAFRYALSLEGCATAVIGMVTRNELEENVARARNLQMLTPAARADLLGRGRQLAEDWGARFGPIE